jgi:hypothetical protein
MTYGGTAMFGDLLPSRIDNAFRGRALALWLLGLVLLVKLLQSVAVLASGYSIAIGADGIPLDTYPPAAAQTVVALFVFVALSRLILSLLGALVLVRYRSAVPFMCALLALDYLARQVSLHFAPLVRTGAPVGPTVNFVLFVVTILALGLSLWRRRGQPSASDIAGAV